MECAEVRKKLKEYANNEIGEKYARAAMERHIQGCPVCKRELLMWQEVIDRQRAVKGLQSKMPKELKDRIKYRMDKSAKSSRVPAALKKLQAMGNIWNSPLGIVIMGITALVAPVIVIMVLFRTMHPGKSMLAPLLVVFGFAVVFIVMIVKSKKRQ